MTLPPSPAAVDAAIGVIVRGTRGIGAGLIDREYRYVHVNDLLAEMNGLPAAAHAGRSIDEVLPAPAVPLVRRLLDGIFATGQAVVDVPAHFGRPMYGPRQWTIP